MLKNLFQMPQPLRWLTAWGLSVALVPVFGLVPPRGGGTAHLAEQWSSASWWITLCSVAPIFFAAVMMLQRRRAGRTLLVVGIVSPWICTPLADLSRGAPGGLSLQQVAFAVLTLVLVALYLGRSRKVREYFEQSVE